MRAPPRYYRQGQPDEAAASKLRYCPWCGGVDAWAWGLVYHRDVIHVKVRSQPYYGGALMILATIVERTYPKTHGEGKACPTISQTSKKH